MLSPAPSLRARCRKCIAKTKFNPNDPIRFEDLIVRSVEHNLASGRFQRLASSRSRTHPLELEDYIDRVVACACEESARLEALENGDSTAWEQLFFLLTRRAVAIVRQWRPIADIFGDAADFAQQACIIIYHKTYPCDVAFEAWATTILRNLISERYNRSRDALDRDGHPDSLDATASHDESGSTLGELIADGQSLAPFDQVENLMVLLDAIDQLRSPAQKYVIIATYLEEQDDAAIARRLGKTKQAVYNLRERALAKLHEILTNPPRKKSGGKSIR